MHIIGVYGVYINKYIYIFSYIYIIIYYNVHVIYCDFAGEITCSCSCNMKYMNYPVSWDIWRLSRWTFQFGCAKLDQFEVLVIMASSWMLNVFRCV